MSSSREYKCGSVAFLLGCMSWSADTAIKFSKSSGKRPYLIAASCVLFDIGSALFVADAYGYNVIKK